ICRQYQTDRGELPAIALTPALEQKLIAAVVRTEQGPVLALHPNQAQAMASKIADALAAALAQPVLLCTPMLRPHLWRLFTRVLPHIGVLSHNEVPPQLRISTVAVLDCHASQKLSQHQRAGRPQGGSRRARTRRAGAL